MLSRAVRRDTLSKGASRSDDMFGYEVDFVLRGEDDEINVMISIIIDEKLWRRR